MSDLNIRERYKILTVEEVKQKYEKCSLEQLKIYLIAVMSEYTHLDTIKVRRLEIKSGKKDTNIYADYELEIKVILEMIHNKLVQKTGC